MKVNKLNDLLTRKYTKTEAIGIMLSILSVGTVVDILLGRFSLLFIVIALFLIAVGYQQLRQKHSIVISIMTGATVGIIVSIYISKPLRGLTRALLEIERGNFSDLSTEGTFKEFSNLKTLIIKLSSKAEEQSLMVLKQQN